MVLMHLPTISKGKVVKLQGRLTKAACCKSEQLSDGISCIADGIMPIWTKKKWQKLLAYLHIFSCLHNLCGCRCVVVSISYTNIPTHSYIMCQCFVMYPLGWKESSGAAGKHASSAFRQKKIGDVWLSVGRNLTWLCLQNVFTRTADLVKAMC